MPWSVSTDSAIRSSNGRSRACSSAAGHERLRPIRASLPPAGSIAISHSEQLACSPVSGSGATIV